MLNISNVCVTWSMQKHRVFSWEAGVTAFSANMCETNISAWAALQIVGQMWKSSYPGIERCHIHLGQQTQDHMWLLSLSWSTLGAEGGISCSRHGCWVPVVPRAAAAVDVMRQGWGWILLSDSGSTWSTFTSDRDLDLAVKYLRRVCGTGNVYLCK